MMSVFSNDEWTTAATSTATFLMNKYTHREIEIDDSLLSWSDQYGLTHTHTHRVTPGHPHHHHHITDYAIETWFAFHSSYPNRCAHLVRNSIGCSIDRADRFLFFCMKCSSRTGMQSLLSRRDLYEHFSTREREMTYTFLIFGHRSFLICFRPFFSSLAM